MKAIVLEAPGKFSLRTVETPKCPDGGILLEVKYCGLCGSDLRTLRSGHRNVVLPAVLGHEVSGFVAQVGKNYAGRFKVGDALAVAPNVYCGECEFCIGGKHEYCVNMRELAQHWPGGFAQFITIPEEALRCGTIAAVPENMNMAHAAIAEPPSSCLNAQEKLGISLADTVLILGAGPIGCIHIALAKARGATVLVADINLERLALCESFMPDYAFDMTSGDFVEQVYKVTEENGPAVIITANPSPDSQVMAIELAKKGGRVAFFGGLPHGQSEPQLDTNLIHYKGLCVIGTTGFAPRHHLLSLKLIHSGKLPAGKLITHIMPIEDFKVGYEYATQGKALKVVFSI